MSYSFELARGPEQDVTGRLRDEAAKQAQAGEPEFEDHVTRIAKVVDELVRAVGQRGEDVRVRVVGHTNPEHKPREGWAEEFISISVETCP
jgi:hypothetical protein